MPYGSISVDQINNTTGYSLGAGNASAMKNRIINGAMVIDQRNAGGLVSDPASNSYSLDRWCTNTSGSSYYTIQQNAGSVTPPPGFTKYYGVTSTGVNSAATYCIRQLIEGYNVADLDFGKSTAKTITVSFWVRSSLTGTFSIALKNGNYDRAYVSPYTITSANTWEYKSITIPGDTTGTWATDNSLGMTLWFAMGVSAGTTAPSNNSWIAGDYRGASGTTNVMGTNGATFYLTGVQLEVGSVATGYEYRFYQTELNLCYRYYWKFSNVSSPGFPGFIDSSSNSISAAQFPVEMRTTPTLGTTGTASNYSIRYYQTSATCSAVPTMDAVTSQSARIIGTASLSGSYSCYINGGYFGFSAEL